MAMSDLFEDLTNAGSDVLDAVTDALNTNDFSGVSPAISDAVDAAKASTGKPTLIVAETIKGKGVSFMENQVGWHGVAPTAEQAKEAVAELMAQ